jgi:hypothetical protein
MDHLLARADSVGATRRRPSGGKLFRLLRATLCVALLAACQGQSAAGRGSLRGRGAASGAAPFPAGIALSEHGARGQRAVDLLGARLLDVAIWYGKTPTQFRDLLRKDGTLRLDSQGRMFVEEDNLPRPHPNATGAPHRELDVVDGLLVPDAQTFTLHSRPGSQRTIYLDFDGATLTNTAWNTAASPTITAGEFNLDGTTGFSSAELQTMQKIWQRVAEDFAPLEVDVTTEAPPQESLTRASLSDMVYGMTVRAHSTLASRTYNLRLCLRWSERL